MISLARALELLDKSAIRHRTEVVSLVEASGRYLAESVRATFDIPPFSKSAMDGYAVRSEDVRELDASLKVSGIVAAGARSDVPLRVGEAIQIMTGAPVPEGADQVVRVEYSHRDGDYVSFDSKERSTNIIAQGENAAIGEVLLDPRRLRPHDVGVAASVGHGSLSVYSKPVLGIISTGDELREPGEDHEPGTIFNSNAYQLHCQAEAVGYRVKYFGIAKDTAESLNEKIAAALDTVDVLVLSGGVSKGAFDYVPAVLETVNVREVFHRISVKPGRPTYFGIRTNGDRTQYVFGLPGNPVSTFVMFELFVHRLLRLMCGLAPELPPLVATLGESISRNDTERTELIPVMLEGDTLTPVRYGGSSHLNALSRANALIEIPLGSPGPQKGERVNARPI